jgi:serine/threonine protein phosphatase PrpC
MSKDYFDSLSGSSLLKSSTLKILSQLTLPNASSNNENKSTATKLKNSNSLIKSFSYREEKNLKYRKTMEDYGSTEPNLTSDYNIGLFGIYDGHGGTDVVKYIKERLPQIIKENLINRIPIETALTNSFTKVDEELKFYDSDYTGSTATIVLLQNNKIYCANVGDTRCTLFTPSKIERLTYDHRADDISEKERIYTNGGMVVRGRVMGRLMLSRSFGDFELRKFGVVPNPYIYRKELEENEEENQFLIIACDGIWDVLNEEGIQQCIINICNDKNHLQKNVTSTICDELIRSALAEGAWDNLSVLTIKL